MRALYNNQITASNISVNSENTNYPLTNIIDGRLSRFYRSLVNDNLTFTIIGPLSASYCFLLNHNIPEDAEIDLITGLRYFAAGANASKPYIQYSDDSELWSVGGTYAALVINGSINDGDRVIVVGNAGTIYSTVDGVTFTKRNTGSGQNLYGVNFDKDLYIACGATGRVVKSPDLSNWTWQQPDGGYSGIFYDVFFGNNIHVIVGSAGKIMTSPDGTIWTTRTPDDGYAGSFVAGIYGNNLFIIVGSYGEAQTSTDGITWTAKTVDAGFSGILDVFNGVAYGAGLYVVVGTSGKIYSSPDGTTWTERTAAGGYTDDFQDLYYDDYYKIFVAVGEGGEIQTSTDGITWTKQTQAGGFTGYFYTVTGLPTKQTAIWNEDYIYFNFTEISKNYYYLEIDFDNDSNEDDYIEIGYLYLGTYLQLPGMKPDQQLKYSTTTKNKISDSGQAYANKGYRFRNPKINFPSWTETQRQNMITLWNAVENHTPFIMLIWAEELDIEPPLFCVLDQDDLDWKKSVKPGSGIFWALTLQLREVF